MNMYRLFSYSDISSTGVSPDSRLKAARSCPLNVYLSSYFIDVTVLHISTFMWHLNCLKRNGQYGTIQRLSMVMTVWKPPIVIIFSAVNPPWDGDLRLMTAKEPSVRSVVCGERVTNAINFWNIDKSRKRRSLKYLAFQINESIETGSEQVILLTALKSKGYLLEQTPFFMHGAEGFNGPQGPCTMCLITRAWSSGSTFISGISADMHLSNMAGVIWKVERNA